MSSSILLAKTFGLEPVMLDKNMSIENLLEFYMGKNTPDRQNLSLKIFKVELDIIESN